MLLTDVCRSISISNHLPREELVLITCTIKLIYVRVMKWLRQFLVGWFQAADPHSRLCKGREYDNHPGISFHFCQWGQRSSAFLWGGRADDHCSTIKGFLHGIGVSTQKSVKTLISMSARVGFFLRWNKGTGLLKSHTLNIFLVLQIMILAE